MYYSRCIRLLFSVAAHSFSLTTHFDPTFFHAVMVHFGNIHHKQREIPLGVILLLFLYGISGGVWFFLCALVCLCVFVGECGCVREHLQRDQPWGCRCISAVEKEQSGWK